VLPQTNFRTVDDYMALQPAAALRVLERVRDAIRKAVPGAEESISYRMPTYKLGGSAVLYFAGWKQHYSLYPASPGVVAALKDELTPYEIRNATIRFPLSEPVPIRLIGRIAKLRAKEVTESEKAKAAAKKR
jgi:uncharacterized protein YdhG (YjbR/CyaY superfamily)